MLERFGILTKIMLLMAPLGLVTVGAVVFCSSKMSFIDETYIGLLDGPVRANLAMSRDNRNMIYVDRTLFSLVTEETSEGVSKALKEVADYREYFARQMKIAASALPDRAAEVADLASKFEEAMAGPCARTIELSSSGVPSDRKLALTSLRSECDPAISATMFEISALTNRILKSGDEAADKAEDVVAATIWNAYVLVIGGLLLVSALVVAGVLVGISRPIRVLTNCMNRLAGGEDTVQITGRNRQDEIGLIAKAVETFRQNSIRKREVDTHDARYRVHEAERRQHELGQLAAEFETTVRSVIAAVGTSVAQLEKASVGLSTTARSTDRLSEGVASASQQASENIRSVAAATQEVLDSVNVIAGQSTLAKEIAEGAVAQAARTDDTISELSAASGRIGDVIRVIADIAKQTNLLALNATIEAARGGEAGRGFAVVAGQVKVLAEQTARATHQVGEHIQGIQRASSDAVGALGGISHTIARMHEIASDISATATRQEAATLEISRKIHATAQEAGIVAANISEVSEGARHTGSESGQLLNAARMLAQGSEHLSSEVGNFLTRLKAAS